MADEPPLPTIDDIFRIPKWARVAFAARCARRVQPLFKKHAGPDVPRHHLRNNLTAVENAIGIAEYVAANAYVNPARAAAARAAAAAVADAACAGTAYAAAKAAVDADAIRAAAVAASRAAAAARDIIGCNLARVIRNDYATLADLADARGWTDETPVPPTVFGPMWPDGPPPGWPTDDPIRGLILDLFAGPDTPPDVIEEGLVRIYTAANQYHMARGAGVLSVDKFRQMVSAALVPAGE